MLVCSQLGRSNGQVFDKIHRDSKSYKNSRRCHTLWSNLKENYKEHRVVNFMSLLAVEDSDGNTPS